MRITSIQPELIREIPFLNAGRGPGGFYRDTLPVHHGFVDELPEGMSAIIATADLQGRETFESSGGKPIRLLGEVLPTLLAEEINSESRHRRRTNRSSSGGRLLHGAGTR